MEIQLEIVAVAIAPTPFDSIVFLRKIGGKEKELLLIDTDEDAASAIDNGMIKNQQLRPLIHELLKNCIEALGGSVQKVVIGEFKDGVARALIHIDCGNKIVLPIDSRPVDALALAVRVGCPICMEENAFEKGKIKPPGKEEKKRQKIDTLEELKQQQLEKLSEHAENIDPSKIPQD